VRCRVRILYEKARAIHLEPVGEDGKGVEFYLSSTSLLPLFYLSSTSLLPLFYLSVKDGTREYHQVKRQHGGGGAWTIPLLARKGVLSAFQAKLASPGAHCVFVSMTSADDLRELAERARFAQDADVFQSGFLKAKDPRQWFATLRNTWGDCPALQAYEWLRRVRVETVTERILREQVEFDAAALVDAEPANVVDILAELGGWSFINVCCKPAWPRWIAIPW
jgi:hypothetical protein